MHALLSTNWSEHVVRTPKARALGIALRTVREERNMTSRQLGNLIGRHSGEISRWETGERSLSPERVAQILTALGVNGDRYEEIVALAYDTKNPPWVATTLPERDQQMAALIEFERNASRITDVCPLLVPGLLQEQGYVQAVMGGGGIPVSEIPHRVSVRLNRRDVVTRQDPVQLVALIGEAVLHQLIGSKKVMAAQLRFLLHMNRLPNVDIRIMPRIAGWHPALEGAFTLIESDCATPIIQLENRRSTLFLHEEGDIKAYQHAVDQLQEVSLSPEYSMRMIGEIVRRWEES